MSSTLEVADLAMGWFWQPDNHFSSIDGVEEVIVGYSGGSDPFPSFECKKDHVETVRVIFDPTVIEYDEILDNFLEQGGLPTGCRSTSQTKILVHNETQLLKAQGVVRMLQRARLSRTLPIVQKAGDFYRAEEHHQKYLEKLRHSLPRDYDVSWMWSSLSVSVFNADHGAGSMEAALA